MIRASVDIHFGHEGQMPTVRTDDLEGMAVYAVKIAERGFPGSQLTMYMSPTQWIEFKNQVLAADRKMFK